MDSEHTSRAALDEAVQIIGGQSAMARLCSVKQPSVWHWVHKAFRLPGEHVLAVEEATGVSRHRLRPDLYPTGQSASPTDAEQFVDCEPVISGLDLPVQSNRMPLFDGRPEAA